MVCGSPLLRRMSPQGPFRPQDGLSGTLARWAEAKAQEGPPACRGLVRTELQGEWEGQQAISIGVSSVSSPSSACFQLGHLSLAQLPTLILMPPTPALLPSPLQRGPGCRPTPEATSCTCHSLCLAPSLSSKGPEPEVPATPGIEAQTNIGPGRANSLGALILLRLQGPEGC